MARINLLPWREERRKQRQQDFFVMLGLSVALAGAVMGAVHFFVDSAIEFQRERNSFLNREIAQLDKQIKEINTLEAMKKRLLARIDIIQQLQSSRPEVVHLVDELARTLPDGVYLTNVVQENKNITLKGMAQSNARVSTYMWNLDKSDWLDNPNLDVIHTSQKAGARTSEFVLRAAQMHNNKDTAAEKIE
jgi:type IV pilus assembly protein PilN